MAEVAGAIDDGIVAIALFPAVKDELKSPRAEESFNPGGLVPRAVRMLKEKWPFLVVVTDVALDPYNSDGHDGIVDGRPGHNAVLNDPTVRVLCKQAVCQVCCTSEHILYYGALRSSTARILLVGVLMVCAPL